ncbi:hypothetical protein DIPPA_10557 [Diplonema papillatum]|nr:hypothetical protein DIPPA_10557 [Diplonema papillatum]
MSALPASEGGIAYKRRLLGKLLETGGYDSMLRMASNLRHLPPKERSDETRVFGCLSKTYLRGEAAMAPSAKATVRISGHSDSLISKGVAGMLASLFDGQPLEDVRRALASEEPVLSLASARLSLARTVGFSSMVALLRQQLAKEPSR